MRSLSFWDVTPCRLVNSFGGSRSPRTIYQWSSLTSPNISIFINLTARTSISQDLPRHDPLKLLQTYQSPSPYHETKLQELCLPKTNKGILKRIRRRDYYLMCSIPPQRCSSNVWNLSHAEILPSEMRKGTFIDPNTSHDQPAAL